MTKLSTHFNRDNIKRNLAAFRQGRAAIAAAEERARQPKPEQAPAYKVSALGT
ncbi:MAG: hypothetical protein KGL10_01390 [Alphaproteobacteria bacterium]|nr:hypothetical protein [Alphaproteobacteria bacterium]MDE2335941.1 hypothetical protein [Alphaproteobacteria bacterium]